MSNTPDATLDKEIHHPTRLALVSYLSVCAEAEFGVVRDYCRVSDSMLSKTISALEKVGYVSVRKGYLGKRPRTWVALSPTGRRALTAHLAALEEIARSARQAGLDAQSTAGRPGGEDAQR
ncbi:transcriptional regulator [Streptomyces alfalfae]